MRPTTQELRDMAGQGKSDRAIGLLFKLSPKAIKELRARSGIQPGRIARGEARRFKDRYGSYVPEAAMKKLPDETVWFGILGGKRYEDIESPSEGRLRMRPGVSMTADSSMAWAG